MTQKLSAFSVQSPREEILTQHLLFLFSHSDLGRHCSGHGTFLPETCSCHCEQGWEGADCEQPTCPGACSGHGRCVDGRCLCDEPYVGADCAYPSCPQDCSGHGVCVQGVCQCHDDFTSEDCSELRCPGDCSGHGFCDTGECYCELGFTGPDCSQGENGDAPYRPPFLPPPISPSSEGISVFSFHQNPLEDL
jgi:hypothetical protein